jgi:phosphopentomutase
VLVHGLGPRALGQLAFTDVAASIAAHLGITAAGPGTSFI